MSADIELRNLAQIHGVHTEFFDLHGTRNVASPDTLRALLRALGVEADTPQAVDASLRAAHVVSQTRNLPLEHISVANEPTSLPLRAPCHWTVTAEDGERQVDGRADALLILPALRVGYYLLHADFPGQTETMRILVRPAQAPDLKARTGQTRCWGMTGALYGLRSKTNGGLGSYTDLKTAAASLGAMGAQFFGINPVHALGWANTEVISPYSPSHREFFNTDYISLDGGTGPTPQESLVDYAGFRHRHRAALEQAYLRFKTSADQSAFRTWQASVGSDLQQFAQFEAISERHGHDFRQWPTALRIAGPAATETAGARSEFHAWLQWKADTQINAAQTASRDAGMSLGLYLDLAVGPRPGGAEVWMNPKTIAKGVSIGAPPDHLSPEGQSWALAAHAPGPLAEANYAPFRAVLRGLMTRCGLLRIDHALGLARSFWLADDGSPGGYITQPFASLLAVIQIEAAQAGCVVIGEDLGLVPAGFREQMNAAGLYSYAVWQFECASDGDFRRTEELAPYSLACFGTHDTPTVNGFWHGTDIEWWRRVGWLDGADRARHHAFRARQRGSLRTICGLAENDGAPVIIDRIYDKLAQAPCELVSVQIDDALAVVEAQNLPGTVDQHPNWQRRLSVPVEDFAATQALIDVADRMTMSRPLQPALKDEEVST